MEYTLYFDGSTRGIAWQLKGDPGSAQTRKHPEIYLDRVTREQARYIALHAGIFWCVGTFRIRNSDAARVMVPSEDMLDYLEYGVPPDDDFIVARTGFIDRLVRQRDLTITYHAVQSSPATGLLRGAGLWR